ncbi:hypothetical protein HMPREF3213_02216 [Heyndrickxia coagulans]|uniref:Uncharacterized protein n=1 Tax=Heyndrickxia coagulans TaxID=1398 RepID=A0A133KMH0_HEYCO|nr:hypothetical protein HMPREF3213_02216 [Heyndrickxia coagulans]
MNGGVLPFSFPRLFIFVMNGYNNFLFSFFSLFQYSIHKTSLKGREVQLWMH